VEGLREWQRSALRIGAGWMTIVAEGRTITWHNGGTGGFRAWLGLDRDAATAVVLLSARASPVDSHGFVMLAPLGSWARHEWRTHSAGVRREAHASTRARIAHRSP
jgi:CubicO group peptidase (beta-lactamase class C family)